MKKFKISQPEEGLRLDRYLSKLLPNAGKGLLQKMMRKKNILLNGAKADPSAKLAAGDEVILYFSDGSFANLSATEIKHKLTQDEKKLFTNAVYEDKNIIVVNKPEGILSQPDGSEIPSVSEMAVTYLVSTEKTQPTTFRPGVANRLDRNTTGLIMIPKNLPTKQAVDEALAEKKAVKEYRTVVIGSLTRDSTLTHYLIKNAEENRTTVYEEPVEGSKKAVMTVKPISEANGLTYVKVRLITGRSHQIRAQLLKAGFPIVGDTKYADPSKKYNKRMILKYQLLHSYRTYMPALEYDFTAPLPPNFIKFLKAHELSTEN